MVWSVDFIDAFYNCKLWWTMFFSRKKSWQPHGISMVFSQDISSANVGQKHWYHIFLEAFAHQPLWQVHHRWPSGRCRPHRPQVSLAATWRKPVGGCDTKAFWPFGFSAFEDLWSSDLAARSGDSNEVVCWFSLGEKICLGIVLNHDRQQKVYLTD